MGMEKCILNYIVADKFLFLNVGIELTTFWFRLWHQLPTITLTPYMVLPLFAIRFAGYAGGIRVSFMQPRLF